MQNYSDEGIVNLGPGSDVTIVDLVGLICKVVGYQGGVKFDSSRPDGVPRKMVDTSLRRLARLEGADLPARRLGRDLSVVR